MARLGVVGTCRDGNSNFANGCFHVACVHLLHIRIDLSDNIFERQDPVAKHVLGQGARFLAHPAAAAATTAAAADAGGQVDRQQGTLKLQRQNQFDITLMIIECAGSYSRQCILAQVLLCPCQLGLSRSSSNNEHLAP